MNCKAGSDSTNSKTIDLLLTSSSMKDYIGDSVAVHTEKTAFAAEAVWTGPFRTADKSWQMYPHPLSSPTPSSAPRRWTASVNTDLCESTFKRKADKPTQTASHLVIGPVGPDFQRWVRAHASAFPPCWGLKDPTAGASAADNTAGPENKTIVYCAFIQGRTFKVSWHKWGCTVYSCTRRLNTATAGWWFPWFQTVWS